MGYQKLFWAGLLYGTAKVYKLKESGTFDNLSLRPIISNLGTATYKTAKYLAAVLSTVTSSEYNTKTRCEFVDSLKNTKLSNGYKMI